MRPSRALPLLLLALGCLAVSTPAQSEADCSEVSGIGCYYAPDDLRNPGQPDLLIYFRGHILVNAHPEWRTTHPDWVTQFRNVSPGRIQDSLLLASARQAFSYYGLKGVADAAHLAILVTGSSHIPVQPATLQGLAAEQLRLKARRFGTVHLASHSGGYVGLGASRLPADAGSGRLETVRGFGSVLLLDTFYNPAGLAGTLKTYQNAGAACGGYYTPHNAARAAAFKRSCDLKSFDSDAQHETQVGPILNSSLLSYYGDRKTAAGPGSQGAHWENHGDFVSKYDSPKF